MPLQVLSDIRSVPSTIAEALMGEVFKLSGRGIGVIVDHDNPRLFIRSIRIASRLT